MRSPRPRVDVVIATPSPVTAARIRRLARQVLAAERCRQGVSVVVVDDRRIRALNRKYLRHDWATDVIAFPLSAGSDPGGARVLGEVFVSAPTARREARRRGITAAEELSRYIIHGILHLCGYDDHRPSDRRRMWARQEKLLFPTE